MLQVNVPLQGRVPVPALTPDPDLGGMRYATWAGTGTRLYRNSSQFGQQLARCTTQDVNMLLFCSAKRSFALLENITRRWRKACDHATYNRRPVRIHCTNGGSGRARNLRRIRQTAAL